MVAGLMTSRGNCCGRQSENRGTVDFRSLRKTTEPDAKVRRQSRTGHARPHESGSSKAGAPEMRGTVSDRASRRKSSGSIGSRKEKTPERSRPRVKEESFSRSRPIEQETTRGRSRPRRTERRHEPQEPQRQEKQVPPRAAKDCLVQARPVLSAANSTPVGERKCQQRNAVPLQQAPLAGERPTGPVEGGRADAPLLLL